MTLPAHRGSISRVSSIPEDYFLTVIRLKMVVLKSIL